MPKIITRKLSSLEPGVECVVRRVKNQDSDILRKLERKGILPGVSLEVVSNDTDQEKLTLKVEGKKVELSRTLASQDRKSVVEGKGGEVERRRGREVT